MDAQRWVGEKRKRTGDPRRRPPLPLRQKIGMDLSCSCGPKDKSRSSCNANFQQAPLHKPNNPGRVLRRSTSQKDLSQAHDSYSSYSSSVTVDDAREVHTNKNGNEKTIKAVYSLEKMKQPEDGEGTGFYEAMRKELQNVVGEIKTELEKVMVKPVTPSIVNGDGSQSKRSNVIEVIADIRNSTTNLEQSEKRKQELLAKLAAEEQRGQELTKTIRELLSESKQTTATERSSQSQRRSNDRTLMSKRLDEKVERYLEEFLSNVEDTEGQKDGVTFPWLQWETSTDLSPSPCKNKMRVPNTMELGNNLFSPTQEAGSTGVQCTDRRASFGSWGREGSDSSASVLKDIAICRQEIARDQSSTSDGDREGLSFDMDEYLLLQQNEDLLFESLRQRHRIESGGLLVCRRSLL